MGLNKSPISLEHKDKFEKNPAKTIFSLFVKKVRSVESLRMRHINELQCLA